MHTNIYCQHADCVVLPIGLSFLPLDQILNAMSLAKTAASALKLLIDVGYFPVHVNLDLLKLRIPTDHSEEMVLAADRLLSDSSDPDEVSLICLINFC